MYDIYILTAITLTEDQIKQMTDSYMEDFDLGSARITMLKFPTNDDVYLCYHRALDRAFIHESRKSDMNLIPHYGPQGQDDLQALVLAPLWRPTRIYLSRLKGTLS